MPMTSVIIPARNERWLNRTVSEIYDKFSGSFEVFVVLDGPTNYSFIASAYPNLHVIKFEYPQGIRSAINTAAMLSQGEYILKLDAHVALCQDFDKLLLSNIEDDWVVVARRYTLDLECWEPRPRIVDYYYLSCPWTHPHSLMMQSCPWITRTGERFTTRMDDLMCFQGSMWMTSRKHWDWLGGLQMQEVYAEHHEISMKTWLGGRRVVINKDAWYAHPRVVTGGYRMDMDQVYRDHEHSALYWTTNQWQGRLYNFDWLIDKFWPLPLINTRHRTEKYYWPETWKSYYAN